MLQLVSVKSAACATEKYCKEWCANGVLKTVQSNKTRLLSMKGLFEMQSGRKKPSNLKLHFYVIVLLLFFVTWHFCPDLQRIFVYTDTWWATACSREKLFKHVQSGIETVKMWIIFIPTFSKQRGFKPFSYEFLSFILLFFFFSAIEMPPEELKYGYSPFKVIKII